MSFQAVDQLTQDPIFQGRVRACAVREAEGFRNDQRPAWVALALDQLRGGGASTLAFVRLIAAFPGIVEGAETVPAEGARPTRGFDQSSITDATILAQVQSQWETVAGLYWDTDGQRLEL